jgi:hypothetical protein
MCTMLDDKKLAQFKKKQSIVGYKIVSVSVFGEYCAVYDYCISYRMNETKLVWDKLYPPFEKSGFSIFLNKKDATKVLKTDKLLENSRNLHLYKVLASNVVNIGKWGYSSYEGIFNQMNVAEARTLEFLEQII